MIKKLIEVALPLDAINKESAREKSIRHGHPSTLHLWWARRPLAAARAVIWASLVDDPSSHPEQFPTEEEQNAERQRLFAILEKLVVWENSNNEDILNQAKAEIIKSTNGNPPALLDPFAGGGAIPLEAQRLGLEAHAHDLNPVAVMINKAMIEIPPKFAGQPPVNPDAKTLMKNGWQGAAGLAEDVHYYGEWLKQEAFKRIGHLYPKVKDENGREHTVAAWIWARTVKCPNPVCGCEMPLVSSFELSKKRGAEAWVEPIYSNNKLMFKVHNSVNMRVSETVNRKGAICANCNTPVDFSYIRDKGKHDEIGTRLMAVVVEGTRRKLYYSPDDWQEQIERMDMPEDVPESYMPEQALGFRVQAYGINQHKKLFSNRQLTALVTLEGLIKDCENKIEQDAVKAGFADDKKNMSDGGLGARAYGQAVGVYLAFAIDKEADMCSSFSTWNKTVGAIRNTFSRQALSMKWDYAETNLFSSSAGSFTNMLEAICKCINQLPVSGAGNAHQFDAQTDCGLRNIMVSTDPPYYDNIGYADLSDFFYIWLRQSLKEIYPDLFQTMLVPKTEELIATPFRFGGNNKEAKYFFENGMLKTCKQISQYVNGDIPVTVYYAYKQSETDLTKNVTASTGWETMLTAIIDSGFTITGTWPLTTERSARLRSIESNALASSVVLVCRKRPENAMQTTRRDFINILKRELKPALQKLQASNIAPVDLAQSAIGPGMGVYSRFAKVLEADGTLMSVRSALQIINQELDLYFSEQDGELDKESRFCVDLYMQNAFNDMRFGEADVLARAKNTSVDKLKVNELLYAEKGVVRLLTREEIPTSIDVHKGIWLLTQQLTHAMEKDGVEGAAKIVANIFTSKPERAKALAYRLFTIAERRGWAGEALAYNSLIIAWPEVQSRVSEIKTSWSNSQEQSLF